MSDINPSRTHSNVRPGWPRVQVPAYFSEYRAALDGRSRADVGARATSTPSPALGLGPAPVGPSPGHEGITREVSTGGVPHCLCHHAKQRHDEFGMCVDCCCAAYTEEI